MVISVSPSASSPFAIRYLLHPALQLAFFESGTQLKYGHASCVTGGSDPTNFWADSSPKSGVAPARFSVFSTVTFVGIGSLSPTLQRNCSRHRLKNLEKTKLKKVILTLFSCSVRILTAHRCTTRFVLISASVSWAGATATVSVATKWGRSSPTRCHSAAILTILSCATSSASCT